ncbi:hypothetical protein EB796_012779 [Bugula neritina]|uniref:Uncharacterized protein n=1 Tax=Bugula neritina TaxID=10212 RepID=A0A7J7JSN9_BUGNE|nr:hypothetical protein EB796_012779 [Bugula neritina]
MAPMHLLCYSLRDKVVYYVAFMHINNRCNDASSKPRSQQCQESGVISEEIVIHLIAMIVTGSLALTVWLAHSPSMHSQFV